MNAQKYIWWKEIVVGPFLEEDIKKLNMKAVEALIDELLKQGKMPRTPALNQEMMDSPNTPHIFHQQ